MVCIFAEGAISRTGNMLPFKRGMEKIVSGTEVPIIPVHLDRLWGSIFSFERGKFFWKWPRRIPYPVTVSFGAPMPSSSTAHEVRQAIQELASDATAHRQKPGDTLGRRVIHNARRHWNRFAMADSTGRELTYGRMLTGAVLVSRSAELRAGESGMVGVLLPPTVAGALVNSGITLAGKVPVNLNFTAGPESMASAVAQCSIQTVVTSKLFLAKAKLEATGNMVFVEDILARASKFATVRALLAARLMPAGMLNKRHELATVIFSSGSTGVPKGVMLSHDNVLANIEAMAQLFWINADDRIVGVLPFFHSFGFTVTIWFPLIAGCGVVYHPNPTDATAIGELVEKYHATLLLSTPTFCSTYTRKCSREEFAIAALRAGGRGETARADRRGIPRKVRRGTAGRLRLHRDGAGGGGQRAQLRSGQGSADGQQARHGGTSSAWDRGAGGGPRESRAAGGESGRPAAGARVESHGGLPGPAGTHR